MPRRSPLKSIGLIALILLINVTLYSQAKLHFYDQYSTIGYSIERIANTDEFVLAGTLYKQATLGTCSVNLDSTDIHFLIIDADGNIILDKVFDSGANDFAYHITSFNQSNNEYLITGAAVGVATACSPSISNIKYLIVNNLGAIVNQKTYSYYLSPGVSSGITCYNQIGMRDIRPFKSIVNAQGITTVGMQKGYLNLFGNNIFDTPKSGFVKHISLDLNPIWDRLYLNNSTPCTGSSDFDMLEDIIEVPGFGYFISGSTTIIKGSVYDQGVVACLIDYNGVKVHDWSHFTTKNPNSNVHAAASVYSDIDRIIYLLENDEDSASLKVLGFDPLTGLLTSNVYTINSSNNPDDRTYAFSIHEDANNSNELVISGLCNKIGSLGPSDRWVPFLIKFDKSSAPSNIHVLQQSGAYNNTDYNLRGDEVQRIPGLIPQFYTPQMTAQFDASSPYDFMMVGYDYSNVHSNYGLKFIRYENVFPSTSENNSCHYSYYDLLQISNKTEITKVSDFIITTESVELNYNDVSVSYTTYTCNDEGVYKNTTVGGRADNDKGLIKKVEFCVIEGQLQIKYLEKFAELEKIELYNLSGQRVLVVTDIPQSDYKVTLNLRPPNTGLYLVKSYFEDHTIQVAKLLFD